MLIRNFLCCRAGELLFSHHANWVIMDFGVENGDGVVPVNDVITGCEQGLRGDSIYAHCIKGTLFSNQTYNWNSKTLNKNLTNGQLASVTFFPHHVLVNRTKIIFYKFICCWCRSCWILHVFSCQDNKDEQNKASNSCPNVNIHHIGRQAESTCN